MPQKKTVSRQCLVCGKPFLAQPRDIERGRGKFCSRYCCGSAGARVVQERHPQQGEGNFNFKGWKTRDKSAYTFRSMRRYPSRHKARYLLALAIARGDVVRPHTCSQCGDPGLIHGHHEDYRYPLMVRWLCRPCHRALHDQRRLIRRLLLAS
jgi:hypothetical protein